jgi:hypothetical protein
MNVSNREIMMVEDNIDRDSDDNDQNVPEFNFKLV